MELLLTVPVSNSSIRLDVVLRDEGHSLLLKADWEWDFLLLPLPALLLREPKICFFFLDFIYHLLASNTSLKIVYSFQEWELWECQKPKFSITDQCFELQIELPEQVMFLLPLSPVLFLYHSGARVEVLPMHSCSHVSAAWNLSFAVLRVCLRPCPSAVGLAQVKWWALGFPCCNGGRMGWWNCWEDSGDVCYLEVCTKKKK